MIFNSVAFAIFFICFFFLYWFVFNKSLKLQNLLILLGGYVFYGWSDWRFLSFLIVVSALNFFLGIYIDKTKDPKYRRLLLYIGLVQGIGGLVFFKYFNFFIVSFNNAFHSLGINVNLQTLTIIIPLGISFFTFRTVSYLIDIDKGKIKPTMDWVVFFNYVSFFPCVLSGPIDKAISFIPQLEKKRVFDYHQATDGMRQILWGLFKKVVVADNCATITNQIFADYQVLRASSLLLGAFLFTIQLYADFSGYSDMAIGISRICGFIVTKNFNFPFFSQNIAEFWRRWHISFTSWLTEYVFTPLSIAFRDYGRLGLILSILINFTLIGIWHGANWTFVLFGFLYGCYFIPLIMSGGMNRGRSVAKGKLFPSSNELRKILGTFILVVLTNILFRAESVSQAFGYWRRLFSFSLFSLPELADSTSVFITMFFIFVLLSVEWLQREREHGLEINHIQSMPLRWISYVTTFSIILIFGASSKAFVYFQF